MNNFIKHFSVAELLLLSSHFRPIKTENTNSLEIPVSSVQERINSLMSAREQINSSLCIILEIVNDVYKAMQDMKSRWKVICDMLCR